MSYPDRRAAGAALAARLADLGAAQPAPPADPGAAHAARRADSGVAKTARPAAPGARPSDSSAARRAEPGAAPAARPTEPGVTHPAIVLGLVRGGVPVAAEIAQRLGLPLDVLVVRKLGVPWAPEVAFGALGPRGVRVLNEDISVRLTPEEISAVVRHESAELARRERRFRAGRPELDLAGRTALIVDDGLATGATARAAVAVARKLNAARIVLAVPVGSVEAVTQLKELADEVVCPLTPPDFGAVSRFYDDFRQVTDAEVVFLLESSPV